MKKILFLGLCLLILVGCGNNDNSKLIADNYIKDNDYTTIYNDLSQISNNIQYIPTKENEQKFYEMIEAIKNDYTKFSNEELERLYNLINIDYNFKYNLDEYDDQNFENDLKMIKEYITG